MAEMKPIKLYAHNTGPNPWKVVIVLEELGIPYDMELMDLSAVKKEPYISINPNGRVPAIQDPNTGITLWESGAIIQYLVDLYDKEDKLTFRQSPEKYLLNQWLHFQMSGQGPYFGQAAWFKNFHPEKLPSAIERYEKEVQRVISVLDTYLTGRDWLVGNKCTYADLAFVTWAQLVPWFFKDAGGLDIASKWPNYHKWMSAMEARPAVKKTLEMKAEASKKGH